MVFYSPFDIVYTLAKLLPGRIVIGVGKEIHRTRKIYEGVADIAKVYPTSLVIIVIVGVLRGAGGSFLTLFDRLNRGLFVNNSNELLKPSL